MNLSAWGRWCKGGDLQTYCHVSLVFAYPTKNLDLQFSNFKLKFNCILIDYNDHVNDLAKNVPTNICYIHKSNFGELRYKGISNL